MTNNEFIEVMNSGFQIKCGSAVHLKMHELSQEAIRITAEINNGYHTPQEIRSLMEELTGQEIDEKFGLFPPFYTDCGKNIHIGKSVFINAGCKFQDQGGIYIGDNCLIGHNTIIATLNHCMLPEERGDMLPKPVHIGNNVWIGSGSVILSGVTIGDNAVIGAGSVVTKDIPADMIAVGSPAKVIRSIYDK
ncbi:MAG: sugar O-acetyltransferase [Ruminococcus sp.]|nr:sugar O-acetyltransferase [Ruminococcus sp.]